MLTAEGPPHERHFTCAAVVGGEQLGVGEGNSKKAAEQEAAREALERLDGLGRASLILRHPWPAMAGKRVSNSDLHLQRLEEEDEARAGRAEGDPRALPEGRGRPDRP